MNCIYVFFSQRVDLLGEGEWIVDVHAQSTYAIHYYYT